MLYFRLQWFWSNFTSVLNHHAHKKNNNNHKPHMQKKIRKTIMLKSKLKDKAKKTKMTGDISTYKKQLNYIIRLTKNLNRIILMVLVLRKVQQHFWIFISLIFPNVNTDEKTKVLRWLKKILIFSEMKIASTFRKSFSQTVELFKWSEVLPNIPNPLRNCDRVDRNWPWLNIKATQV